MLVLRKLRFDLTFPRRLLTYHLQELVTFLNEKKRDKEAAQKVAEIANAIDGLETPIVNPTRRFQLEAQLGLVKGNQVKKRTVFLLNDLLVFAKVRSLQRSVRRRLTSVPADETRRKARPTALCL